MPETDLQTQEELQSPGADLADDFYAKPEDKVEPDPEPKLDDEPKPEEVKAEEPEQPDEQQHKQELTDEVTTEEPVESDEEVEEVEVTTVAQLAEHLETDPEWLETLTIEQKVNGETIEVKLADALQTHRQVTAGDTYLADAKSKAKAMLDESTKGYEEAQVNAAMFASLIGQVEAALTGDLTDENWATLRKQDPAEYTAKKEEVRERREALATMREKGEAALAGMSDNLKAQRKAQLEANLPAEQEKFLERVPEWNDDETAERESVEIAEYLSGLGATQEDIEEIAYNSTYLSVARDAMLYRKGKGKIDAGKKKVVKIPKVMKPGKKAEKTQSQGDPNDRVSIMYGNS